MICFSCRPYFRLHHLLLLTLLLFFIILHCKLYQHLHLIFFLHLLLLPHCCFEPQYTEVSLVAGVGDDDIPVTLVADGNTKSK